MKLPTLILCVLALQCYSQFSENHTWEKTFGGNSLDEIQSLEQLDDGGYIAFGSTASKGNGNIDFWLIKLDAEGNIVWDKTYGGTGQEVANYGIQTNDDGFILTGYTSSYGNGNWDVWLVKTDKDGNEEWNKTFGGAGADRAYCVQQLSDKGYIIAGTNYSFGYGDGYVIKTDSLGKKEWEKRYDNGDEDFFFYIKETFDNNFILSGGSNKQTSTTDTRDLWLLKIDNQGDVLWNKTFDGEGNKDFGHEVIETTDKGFLVTGNKRHPNGKREIWLLKSDIDGKEEWNKVLSEGKDALSRSIRLTSDEGFIVSGFIDINQTGDMDICLIKLDKDFNKQWIRNFGNPNQMEEALIALETTDGGYVAAGFTKISEYNTDCYIVKTDKDGKVGSSIGVVDLENYQLKNYPNPCMKNTCIEFYLERDTQIELTIYSLNGELVFEHPYEGTSGKNEILIDCSMFKGGTYIYKILNEGKCYGTNKIVVAK